MFELGEHLARVAMLEATSDDCKSPRQRLLSDLIQETNIGVEEARASGEPLEEGVNQLRLPSKPAQCRMPFFQGTMKNAASINSS